MKSLFRFVVLVLLVVGWGLAALSLHVVRTPGTVSEVPVTIITKEKLGVDDIYVDTTHWTMEDVARHPAVVERLIETGKADVLKHVVDPDGGTVRQQLSEALGREADTARDESTTSERMARRAGFRWPWDK